MCICMCFHLVKVSFFVFCRSDDQSVWSRKAMKFSVFCIHIGIRCTYSSMQWPACLVNLDDCPEITWHSETWTKWSTVCRWFQIYFREWKWLNLKYTIEICSWGSNWCSKSTVVQVMAWNLFGAKPLLEPVMTFYLFIPAVSSLLC